MSNEILDALKGAAEAQDSTEASGSETATPKETTPQPDHAVSTSNAPDLGLQLQNLTNTVSSLAGKVELIGTQQSQPKEQDNNDLDLDDDDEGTTIDPEVIDKIVEKKFKDRDKVSMSKQWDGKCDEDFGPYGFTNKSSKFYQEAYREYQNSPEKKSPTSVYDAASRTLARGLKEGWIRPNEVQNAIRDYNVSNATVAGPTPGNPGPKKQQTEEYKYFASRLGVPEDKAKEIHEREQSNARRMKLVRGA